MPCSIQWICIIRIHRIDFLLYFLVYVRIHDEEPEKARECRSGRIWPCDNRKGPIRGDLRDCWFNLFDTCFVRLKGRESTLRQFKCYDRSRDEETNQVVPQILDLRFTLHPLHRTTHPKLTHFAKVLREHGDLEENASCPWNMRCYGTLAENDGLN